MKIKRRIKNACVCCLAAGGAGATMGGSVVAAVCAFGGSILGPIGIFFGATVGTGAGAAGGGAVGCIGGFVAGLFDCE